MISISRENFDYLVIPILKGKSIDQNLQLIEDRIIAKLSTWKRQILSMMGRIQLVNLVIHEMLLYNLKIYEWYVSLINKIEFG